MVVRYSAGATASILWSAGVRNKQEAAGVMERLNAAGMATQDISDLPAAQVHLRHLVGGRARSYMGEIPNERIFQVGGWGDVGGWCGWRGMGAALRLFGVGGRRGWVVWVVVWVEGGGRGSCGCVGLGGRMGWVGGVGGGVEGLEHGRAAGAGGGRRGAG